MLIVCCLLHHCVIFHYSAGIGRTGVFIAADIGMRQLEENMTVDALKILATMRQDRGGMVQTKEQYIFLHKVRCNCTLDLIHYHWMACRFFMSLVHALDMWVASSMNQTRTSATFLDTQISITFLKKLTRKQQLSDNFPQVSDNYIPSALAHKRMELIMYRIVL